MTTKANYAPATVSAFPSTTVDLNEIWAEGACRGMAEEDIFFPDRSHGPNGADAAKEVCAGCPVRVECLEYALEAQEEYGVWGGTTPAERRKLT